MIPPKVNVELELKFKEAVDKFQAALKTAATGIPVDLNFHLGNLETVRKEIEKFLQTPSGGVSLFDAKSPVQRKDLIDYLKKFNREFKKIVEGNPALATNLKMDLSSDEFQRKLQDMLGKLDTNFEFKASVDKYAAQRELEDLGKSVSGLFSQLDSFGKLKPFAEIIESGKGMIQTLESDMASMMNRVTGSVASAKTNVSQLITSGTAHGNQRSREGYEEADLQKIKGQYEKVERLKAQYNSGSIDEDQFKSGLESVSNKLGKVVSDTAKATDPAFQKIREDVLLTMSNLRDLRDVDVFKDQQIDNIKKVKDELGRVKAALKDTTNGYGSVDFTALATAMDTAGKDIPLDEMNKLLEVLRSVKTESDNLVNSGTMSTTGNLDTVISDLETRAASARQSKHTAHSAEDVKTSRTSIDESIETAKKNLETMEKAVKEAQQAANNRIKEGTFSQADPEMAEGTKELIKLTDQLTASKVKLAREEEAIANIKKKADKDAAYANSSQYTTDLDAHKEAAAKVSEEIADIAPNYKKAAEAAEAFKNSTTKLGECQKRFKKINDTIRELNMAGVPVPRALADNLGYLGATLNGIPPLMEKVTAGFAGLGSHLQGTKIPIIGDAISKIAQKLKIGVPKQDIDKFYGKFTDGAETMVKGVDGETRKLKVVTKKALGEAFNAGMVEFKNAEGNLGTRLAKMREKFREVFKFQMQQGTGGSSDALKEKVNANLGGLGGAGAKAAGNLAGKFGGFIGKLIGGAIKLFTGAMAAVVTTTIMVAYKVLKFVYTRNLEFAKKHQAAVEASEKYLGDLRVMNVQQEAKLRESAINAAVEIEKKRVENQRELAVSRMKMNADDVEAQRVALSIEQERLKAQKEGELRRQRATNITERSKRSEEYANQIGQVRDSATYEGGVARWLGDFGLLDKRVYDEHGQSPDESFVRAADKGWFDAGEDLRMKQNNFAASEARKAAQAAFRSDFDTMAAEYQGFIDVISSVQVGEYSAKLAKKIKDVEESSEAVFEEYDANQTQIKTAETFKMGFSEARKRGRIKMSSNGEYIMQGFEGEDIALGTTLSGAEEDYTARARDGAGVISQMNDLVKRKEMEESKWNLIKEEAKTEQDTLHLIQERAKLQEELKKNLRDQLQSMIVSASSEMMVNWKQTGEQFRADAGKRSFEAYKQAVLNDPKYLNDPEAKLEKERELAAQGGKNEADLKMKADKSVELLEFEKKTIIDEHQLKITHAQELYALQRSNEVKLHLAKIESDKIGRELVYRTLQRQLDAELVSEDTYGKTRGQIQSEKRKLAISQRFDEKRSTIEKSYAESDAKAKTDEAERFKIENDKLAEQQQKDMAEFDKKQIEEKWALERALMEAQHNYRLAEIKAEVEYKAALEKNQEKKIEAISDSWLKAFADNKEKANEAAMEEFEKNYDELTADQQKQLGQKMQLAFENASRDVQKYEEEHGGMLADVPEKDRRKWLKEDIERQKTDVSKKVYAESEKFMAEAAMTTTSPEYQKRSKAEREMMDVFYGRVGGRMTGMAAGLGVSLFTPDVDEWDVGQSFDKEALDRITAINRRVGKLREWTFTEDEQAEVSKLGDELRSIIHTQLFKNIKDPFSEEAKAKLNERKAQIVKDAGMSMDANGNVVGTAEQEKYLKDVEMLDKYGDVAAKATEIQTEVMVALEQDTHELLRQILAKDDKELADAMKDNMEKTADLANKKAAQLKDQQNAAAAQKARQDKESATNADARLKEQTDALKGLERGESAGNKREEMRATREEHRNQAEADLIKRRSESRTTQSGIDTDFAISMGGAKTGVDWTKAIAKRNTDTQFNAMTTELDMKQRREMEAFTAKGNYTEQEKAALEARHAEEKSTLENSKRLADAQRENMGEVGSLRSLISDSVGQKSGLTESWERIQAAAFGHVEDPAADAVITMDRNMQLQHAALMQVLTLNLPQIAQGMSTGGGKLQLPQELINAMLNRNPSSQAQEMWARLGGGSTPTTRK